MEPIQTQTQDDLTCNVVLAMESARDLIAEMRSLLRSLEELSGREQWSEILRVIPDSTDNAPDLDYYRGMALAATCSR